MATKTIGTILSLKDDFSKTLKGTNNNVKSFQNQIKHTQNNINDFKEKTNNNFGSIARKIAGVVTAVVGIEKVKSFINESVEKAKESVDAETKLEAVLKNVHSLQKKGPEAYKQAKEQLLGVSANLQKVGVVEDDVITSGMQQLATFQLNNKQITTLSGGMADLLAQQKGLNAKSGDAVSIANMIGKAMNGNVGALSRVGISFTKAQAKAIKTGDATKRAATIAQVLKDNVGGVNAALAKTDQGKIQQATNKWNDMKEKIGNVVLQIKGQFAGYLISYLPQISKLLLDLASKAQQGANYIISHKAQISSVINDVIKNIKNGINFIITHKDQIKTALIVIGSLIAGFKIAKTISNVITGVNKVKKAITGLKGLAKAGKLFSSIFGFSPQILLIVAIIAGIAALAYLVIKNWKPIKAFFIGLWNTIVGVFKKIYDTITGVFQNILNFFKGIINIGIDIINGVLKGINKITGFINKIPGVKIGVIPTIPKLENGGIIKHRPGGILANIGEGNKDEAVIPLDKNTKKNNRDIKVYVTIQGNVIGNEEFVDQVGERVGRKLKLALANM